MIVTKKTIDKLLVELLFRHVLTKPLPETFGMAELLKQYARKTDDGKLVNGSYYDKNFELINGLANHEAIYLSNRLNPAIDGSVSFNDVLAYARNPESFIVVDNGLGVIFNEKTAMDWLVENNSDYSLVDGHFEYHHQANFDMFSRKALIFIDIVYNPKTGNYKYSRRDYEGTGYEDGTISVTTLSEKYSVKMSVERLQEFALRHLAGKTNERRVPTIDEIKERITAGMGSTFRYISGEMSDL